MRSKVLGYGIVLMLGLTNETQYVTLVTRSERYIMGKEPDRKLKADLLEQVTNYILQNGLQDLSLRPLAEALGTSARMLIYHFGSKEQLVIEAVINAQRKQQALLQSQMVSSKSSSKTLQNFWNWLSSKEVAPYARLLYDLEVQAMNGNEQYRAFAKEVIKNWETFIQNSIKSTPEQARLIVGVMNGLLMDRLVTGEESKIDKAFSVFLKNLNV
ncbi:MAG: TetR/AcrR family transcriptional regulator [Trueperaceae bacterium]